MSRTVTFVLRLTDMWVPTDQLMNTNPNRLLRRVRQMLVRRGVLGMEGWLFLSLDAEFDVNRGGWDFHVHGVGKGQMVEALESLRTARCFDPERLEPHEQGLKPSTRVWISGPLNNLPHQLTYTLKSMVPHRPTTLQPDGTLLRSKRNRRVPEPHHTEWLLWRDKHKVSDFIACIGIKPTKSGFQYTS